MFDMFRNIVRNLKHGPKTRKYPYEKRPTFNNVRGGIKGIDPEVCIYCSLCEKNCPANAIKVDRENKEWTLIIGKCIICNVCVEVCPKNCICMSKNYRKPGPTVGRDTLVITKNQEQEAE